VGEAINADKVLILEERYHLQDLGVDERVLLKWL
jgi:hypothetical protein